MSYIKIGKNAIENLTIGMYHDSRIIYREYIQNAADSIDLACKDGRYKKNEKPQIEIEIDNRKRIVRIKDNAYGIRESDIQKKLANVADSDKDRDINKGFRGIGRLGGLAYCETLAFITTYPGEAIETTMTWDASELIRMINDPTVKDSAEEVLDKIISYSKKSCDSEAHYFIVELRHIKDENSKLLDVEDVKKYLSANAPVDYNSKFFLKSGIKQFISQNNLPLSEYNIFVDGLDVFKDYNCILYDKLEQYDEIESLEFKEFRNKQNELLAWMWFGVSTFDKRIPECNEMRGIRLRKDNIQIGDDQTLVEFFNEQRGNYYFIGELHAVHNKLIPNARRDYFNENSTRLEFENEIKKYFEFLQRIYYDANRAKSALNKGNRLASREAERAEKERTGFTCEEEIESLESKIAIAKVDFQKSQLEFNKVKEKSKNSPVLHKVICSIEEKHKNTLSPNIPENILPENPTAPKDTAPKNTTPKDTAPKNTAPKNTTPKNTAPKDIAPKDTAPKDIAPKDIAPKDIAPKDIAPKDIAPKDTAPKDIAPKDTAPKDTAPKDTAPKDTAPENPTVTNKELSPENTSHKTPLITDSLIHLQENERKLIGRVYRVIQNVLPPSLSPNLIKKIQDELNKNES